MDVLQFSADGVYSVQRILDGHVIVWGGVQVQTAFGSFLLLLTNMADGAILVMAYTSPLKEKFE